MRMAGSVGTAAWNWRFPDRARWDFSRVSTTQTSARLHEETLFWLQAGAGWRARRFMYLQDQVEADSSIRRSSGRAKLNI